VRHTVLFLAGTVLTGLIGTAPAAHADDPSPLYRLVDTAAQRLQTADPVAAFKWVKGGPIDDPPRSRQVVDSVGADATKQGIDPQPVRTIFTDQVHATEGIEYTRFGQWKLDPAAAPTTAPDLSASRAAIDGFNHQMVTEMARHWDSLRGPECGQQRDDAVRAVAMERQLDPLYQQALTFATHSYCGP
jgi:chorismate mutase